MTVDILQETEEILGLPVRPLLEAVISGCLAAENCPWEAQVSVRLVSDEEIRRCNREFRGIDRVTDVLSFPMLEPAVPGDLETAADVTGCFDPDSGEVCLGDIVISVPQCIRQAEEYGHGVRRELAFLTAHSMLHLMGYDHETDEEAGRMERKQESILAGLGITRD